MQNKVLRTHPARIVAIVGGSGAGKTWLADELQRRLGKEALRLCGDDFYCDHSNLSPKQRERINFDHPRAIDWPALERVLRQLARREPALVPEYDFTTHTRRSAARLVKPRSIILLEGLWLLHRRSIRRCVDFAIYLHCPERVRLRRRIARDLETRGRTPRSVKQQFLQTVVPMHELFVAPQRHWANVTFSCDLKTQEISQLAATIAALAKPHSP